MKWQEFVKDYLTFTRKERIGILVITGLILLSFFLPGMVSRLTKSRPIQTDSTWITAVRKLEIKDSDFSNNHDQEQENDEAYTYQFDKTKNSYNDDNSVKREVFNFDPNTISEAGWRKLGLRDRTIKTIQNYLSKGGHFYKPEDLQKIYGLHDDEYERLAPYVTIERSVRKNKEEFDSEKSAFKVTDAKIYPARYTVIEINTSDTAAFISLPGIGSKLAARIVNFREKLGGFYSIDQVGETYGLPDSTFQKIKQWLKLDNSSIKKININIATIDELKAHPYIKFSIANPIVAYRTEHGLFTKVEDIKNVMVVTDEIYKKIAPYLTTQ